MKASEILTFIPTYNERENIKKLYEEIKKLPIETDFLFLDDNSPDGTGVIIDKLCADDPRVHVIHRPEKKGLGTAHLEAFNFAQKNNYQFLITMDADFTHHPTYIPQLISHKEKTDIIIGSRYKEGGKMSGWGAVRLPFTYFWRSMIKYGLGMPYDCTGAFRLYNVQKMSPHVITNIKSKGFSFCMESLYFFKKSGLSIMEIPIHAQNRIAGKSKLSPAIMTEVARMYFALVADRIRGKLIGK